MDLVNCSTRLAQRNRRTRRKLSQRRRRLSKERWSTGTLSQVQWNNRVARYTTRRNRST